MHLDKGIVRMVRNSDGLSSIPDVLKTLTHQCNRVGMAPPGTLFASPLHGILPGHIPVYVYVSIIGISTTVTITVNAAATSRFCPFICKVSDASAIIGSGSFALVIIADLIRPAVSNLI